VALLDDASILFALEEEKLSRSTGMGGIPRRSIDRALEQVGAKSSDLNLVGVGRRLGATCLREAAFRIGLTFSHVGAADWTRAIGRNARELTQFRHLRRAVGERIPTLPLEHHLCHAASAFYTVDFDRALILTLDESGDMLSGMIALGEGEGITPIRTMRFPNSLGWFYSRVTELLGLRAHHDEHKVQWRSKDGQPDYVAVLQNLFKQDADGFPVLNREYFAKGHDDRGAFSPAVLRELKLDASTIANEPAVRSSLARSAQDVLEHFVLDIAEHFRVQTRANSICLAGGVFLNVLLVRALETRSQFQSVYVQPVSGNAGTALGAALLGRKRISGTAGRKRLAHLFLGPDFTSAQIKAVLDNCKIIYKYMSGDEQLCNDTSQLLLKDKIVAWCQGRTEFGHRALGNRSILASPFSEYVTENINEYIKHREDFHPFALSVPAERAAEFFDCTDNCRFMASLGTLKTTVPSLERFTFNGREVRVHTVDKETNPKFWRLLHKFGERSPAPILVNTSFNLFGEPLVSDPREAIRSFYCAGIDALAIGSFLVVK
jgi:carbamoyltransferase